jgi:zinc protease
MSVKGVAAFLLLLLFVPLRAAFALPEIQHWKSASGARVYFARTEGLPLLDLRVIFDAGSGRDGDRFGLASLTSALLDTGAGEWDADTIAARLEGVGAVLGTGISRDSAWISLRSLTQPNLLRPALETVREILARPRFAQDDFEREKKRVLLALKQREESPGDLAAIAFFEALYGDHPYAHPKDGHIATVEKITRDDVGNFYRRFYVANNAVVVLVGDIDRAQAEQIAEELLSGLAAGETPPPLPPVDPTRPGQTVRKAFPSEQTHVFSGMAGMRVDDPDYFPLYVGNHILGGSGLVSRISEEVREKRGLSYSAFSYFYPFRGLGPFLMGLQSRNHKAEEALTVLQATLKEFLEKGPTEKELEAAKKNITGGFVLRLDSNGKLAEQLSTIAFYGLPLDYLATFIPRVQAVTTEEIRRAWRARIHPDRLVTVLVGPNRSTSGAQ